MSYKTVRACNRTPIADDAPDNPFRGKHIVLSGDIGHYDRGEFQSIIACLGGDAYHGPSKKTDMAIIGHRFGSKAAKIEALIASGKPITILEEYATLKILEQPFLQDRIKRGQEHFSLMWQKEMNEGGVLDDDGNTGKRKPSKSRSDKVDLSSVPTDEYGIPKITPQEMVDVLNDLTHFEATTTAQNIHSSIDAKLHRIVNKPYESDDPNEILQEVSKRNAEIELLKKKLDYWNIVVFASIDADVKARQDVLRRLEEYDDEKDLGKNPSFNPQGCAYIAVGIMLIIMLIAVFAGIAGSCS